MSQMSDFLEVELRKHIFRTGSMTKPAQLHISLHTANPTDVGTGTEVSGGSYARVQRDPSDANWTAASSTDGIVTNAADIVFPSPTANWGLITHVGVWDAAVAGNLICYAALSASKTVNSGDAAPKFLAGQLSFTWA
jgi:hypothetical protein